MRQTLGTAVFAGMLGVTLFGILLTPVFYYVVRGVFGAPQALAPVDSPRTSPEAMGVGNGPLEPGIA